VRGIDLSWAHGFVAPAHVWNAWELHPLVVLPLAGLAAAYGRGVRRLWVSPRGREAVGPRAAGAFCASLGALAVALVSPLHRLGESLFSAHMVQHLLLVLVVAPLFVLGRPLVPLALAVPRRARGALHALSRSPRLAAAGAVATSAVVVWALHTGAMWAWHLPSLYDAALRSDALHGLEHLSFVATAALFWWVVVDAASAARAHPGALLLLFATGLQGAALGAVLTFATKPLYAVSQAAARAWSLSPLSDQQLAGLIMWVPTGAFYLVAMGVLLLRWLREPDPAGAGAPVSPARNTAP
jgi:putative membrane protein